MAQILGVQDQRLLTSAEEVIYTVPANSTYIPKTIALCNVSINTIPVISIWFLPEGISAVEDKYKIVNSKAIVNQETVFINTDIYLQAGYSIVIQTSKDNVISSILSGVVIS